MEEQSRQRGCPYWQCEEAPAGKRVEAHGASTERAAGLRCMICKKKMGGGRSAAGIKALGEAGWAKVSQVTSLLRQKSGNSNPESLGKVVQLAREQTPKHAMRPLYVLWGHTAVLSRGHRPYKAIL